MKTQEYHQPSFYHFSQTVIEAAQWISQYLKLHRTAPLNIVDLFAGSGVFSLELIYRLPKTMVMSWRLIEVQRKFSKYIENNIKDCRAALSCLPQIAYLDSASWLKKHNDILDRNNIILLNPPHSFNFEGKESQNKQKRICMTVEKQYWENFLLEMLKSQATFFLLLNSKTQLFKLTKSVLASDIKLIQPLSGTEYLLMVLPNIKIN